MGKEVRLIASSRKNQALIARMLLDKRAYLIVVTLVSCLLVISLTHVDRNAVAQAGFPDPNANCPPATCGEVSPFIPMQSAEAVHMGLVWKRNSTTPKILFHARFPEYTPNDIADPALVDLAISRGAFSTPGLQFNGEQTGTVEVIDFTDPNPRWDIVGSILQPLATTKAVLLPDGKVLIGQGINRSPNCNVDGRPCTYEEKEGLHFQMFDPVSGSITKLAKTTVSRGLHGTATLLPDGSAFLAGENREALVRPDDPSFPLLTSYAGLLPNGDPDQGVPVGQLFFPPYLFKQDGSRAVRPVVMNAPENISYGGHFDITVAGNPDQISSVVMLRSDHNTHSLTTGDRYVRLSFHQKGAARKGEIRVRAPKLPAQAVPGIYMLFVLDQAGVPSLSKRMYLQ